MVVCSTILLSGCPSATPTTAAAQGTTVQPPPFSEQLYRSSNTFSGTIVDRYRVPGGWIYRTMLSDTSGVSVAQTFVQDPTRPTMEASP